MYFSTICILLTIHSCLSFFIHTPNSKTMMQQRHTFSLKLPHHFRRLSMAQPSGSLFKFGVIADIQYAEHDDAPNFQQTRVRRYRQSFDIYKQALRFWKEKDVKFSVILGDTVDGRTVIDKNQYLCLQNIKNAAKEENVTPYYCFGNHCHYCFSRDVLRKESVDPVLKTVEEETEFPSNNEYANQLYYHWSPHPGYRFVSLDGYGISLIAPSTDENKVTASSLLREHNHNDLTLGNTWFNGLPREKHRWVPFNGGIDKPQLLWLGRVLEESHKRQEKIVIFCHQPIFAPHRPSSLVWNAEEVLQMLWSYDHVLLWMAGHDHGGQHYVDEKGITHFVPPAPIECELGEKTYGYFEVFSEHLKLHWVGKTPCPKTFQALPDIIPSPVRLVESPVAVTSQ